MDQSHSNSWELVFEDALKPWGTHTLQLSTLSKFWHSTLHELTCRDTKVSIISDFLPETMPSKGQWGDIFGVLKERKKKKSNDLEFCIQHNYPSKVKEKYRSSQRSKSRPALQETVWKVPQREGGEGSETQISVKKRRVREEIVKSLRSFLETLTVNGADCYLNPILLENSDN